MTNEDKCMKVFLFKDKDNIGSCWHYSFKCINSVDNNWYNGWDYGLEDSSHKRGRDKYKDKLFSGEILEECHHCKIPCKVIGPLYLNECISSKIKVMTND